METTAGETAGGKKLDPMVDVDELPPIPVPQITYPALELWKRKTPAKDKIKIVNGEDIPISDLLDSLGLRNSMFSESFGTSNLEELKGRQEIVRLLLEDASFRRWVLEFNPPNANMPTSSEAFLEFYNTNREKTPYWQKVHEFCDRVSASMEKTGTSTRLDLLVKTLRNGAVLEVPEWQMADVIRSRIEHMATISGTIRYHISDARINWSRPKDENEEAQAIPHVEIRKDSQKAFGYLRYSTSLAQLTRMETEEAHGFWGIIGKITGVSKLIGAFKAVIRWFEIRRAMRSTSLTRVPPELENDLYPWLQNKLRSLAKDNHDLFRKLCDGYVEVSFMYDQDGLRAMIYNIEPRGREFVLQSKNFFGVDAKNPRRYNRKQAQAIQQATDDFDERFHRIVIHREFGQLLADIRSADEHFLETVHKIPSMMTDKVCRWYAITNLYGSKTLRNIYGACKDHRNFFVSHLADLKNIAKMVETVKSRCDEWNIPLCVVEPLPRDEHLIEFDGIVPIHLLGQLQANKEKARAISLPPLNGKLICLTGYHGGGKTTSLLSVLVSLYMAQSILMAPGSYFRFNPKKVLASLLIGRSNQGSTIELFLEKLRRILEASKRVSGNEMVAVIDELGSATQEADGDALGRKVLKKLDEKGVSIITATQIQTLAKYAEDELHAHNFYLDRKHVVHEGISDGGLEDLSRRKGVAKLLN